MFEKCFGATWKNILRSTASGGGNIVRQWQGNSLFGLEKFGEGWEAGCDHRLAVHGLQTLLEMRHQIGGHQRDAFRVAHQRLQRGPLRLELLLLRQLLAFGDLFKLRVELRQFGGIQAQLGTEGAKWGDGDGQRNALGEARPSGAARESNAALVIDRHRGLVGDGALDVVDADVITEDRPRVRVRLFDGRAVEAHDVLLERVRVRVVIEDDES